MATVSRATRSQTIDDGVKSRPGEHDIARIEALHRLGPLNLTMLFEITKGMEVSSRRFGTNDLQSMRIRMQHLSSRFRTAYDSGDEDYDLTELFPITDKNPLGSKLIERPRWQQLSDFYPNNEAIYDYTPASKFVLEKEYKLRKYAPKRTNSPLHNYFSAHGMGSLLLAARKDGTKKFYYHDEVRASVAATMPTDSFTVCGDQQLEPDPFCTIEHANGATLIHPTEFDCGTETNEGEGRKQWYYKLLKWLAFFREDVPHRVFGPDASVAPLFIFTKEGKKEEIKGLLARMTEGKGHQSLLFKYVPGFRSMKKFTTPGPTYDLLGEYERVWEPRPTFNISTLQ